MAATWIEMITGSLKDKKRYGRYKKRVQQLPENYRTAIVAVERYLMYFGAVNNGEVSAKLNEDLLDLIEQSAAKGLTIREIFGEDPTEFAETFLSNYADGQWIKKERKRLVDTINSVAGSDKRKEK